MVVLAVDWLSAPRATGRLTVSVCPAAMFDHVIAGAVAGDGQAAERLRAVAAQIERTDGRMAPPLVQPPMVRAVVTGKALARPMVNVPCGSLCRRCRCWPGSGSPCRPELGEAAGGLVEGLVHGERVQRRC